MGSPSSSTSRVHRPSPRTSYQQRTKKFWSDEEVGYLTQGVQRFGHSWTQILKSYPFRARSAPDLKDKWRNVTERAPNVKDRN